MSWKRTTKKRRRLNQAAKARFNSRRGMKATAEAAEDFTRRLKIEIPGIFIFAGTKTGRFSSTKKGVE